MWIFLFVRMAGCYEGRTILLESKETHVKEGEEEEGKKTEKTRLIKN